MAVAKCGMMWSWDSPLWCSGQQDNKEKEKMCLSCPWWEGKMKKV